MPAIKIKIVWIGKTKEPSIQSLTDEYLKRISRYVQVEGLALRDEAALLQVCGLAAPVKTKKASAGKVDAGADGFAGETVLVRRAGAFSGRLSGSQSAAACLRGGPADGFSDVARSAAQHTISLGRITLAHELARVVLLEQLYRAFTILKGHPYHSGH